VQRTYNEAVYFLTDHLGSVVGIIDANGTLTSQQRYLPFGEVRADVSSSSAPATDYGYTGQRNLDAALGLMDYKARFYSPYLMRFTQPDTFPQGLNRYSYVNNSPINFNDPTGHCAKSNYKTKVITDDECEAGLEKEYLTYKDRHNKKGGNNSLVSHHPTLDTVNIGGTSPADIPGFDTQEQEYMEPEDPKPGESMLDAFGEYNYFRKAFTAGTNSPTLNVYITYSLIQGSVYELYLTVENHATTSGRLNYIEIETKPLASMNSCVKNEVCRFVPSTTVNFTPKNISAINICTNCMADNTNIFSMPKAIDVQHNYQAQINVSITILFDSGRSVGYVAVPFSYMFHR
jgi:RHS repeat-associated protein